MTPYMGLCKLRDPLIPVPRTHVPDARAQTNVQNARPDRAETTDHVIMSDSNSVVKCCRGGWYSEEFPQRRALTELAPFFPFLYVSPYAHMAHVTCRGLNWLAAMLTMFEAGDCLYA